MGTKYAGLYPGRLTLLNEEAPANSVPAAAVIQRVRALIGITGRKAHVGGFVVGCEIPGLNLGTAFETAELEYGRGRRNSRCSGEMRRYLEEHQWRRRPSGPILTLRCESVGSKQD